MSTTIEIQAMIDEFESNLATLNEEIQSGRRMKASELKNMFDSIKNGYNDILTAINESKVNGDDLPIPMPSENLFTTDNLTLPDNRSHNLNGFQFVFQDYSPAEENDYSVVFKLLRDGFSYSASNSNEDMDTYREIGTTPGKIMLRAPNEFYFNRTVYNTESIGLQLKNSTYQDTWTIKLSEGKIYVIDCVVTGMYDQPMSFLGYSGRFKATMMLDPSTGNAVFFPGTYTADESILDPYSILPVMSCRLNLTAQKVTLQHRNSKTDSYTKWSYEITLRTL